MKLETTALYTDRGTNIQWQQLYWLVSEERRQKADRIRREEQKRQSLAAGGLLEYLLKKNGINGPYHYGATKWGRPFLRSWDDVNREREDIFFSLSHTNALAVCAVSDRPVGVDAERIQANREKIVSRFFTSSERKAMEADASKETFFRIWTQKEAWAKLTDRPLLDVLGEEFPEDGRSWSMCREGYAFTVCSVQPIYEKYIDFISMETLLAGLKKH